MKSILISQLAHWIYSRLHDVIEKFSYNEIALELSAWFVTYFVGTFWRFLKLYFWNLHGIKNQKSDVGIFQIHL